MARIKKKGTSGAAINFVTRAQAVRRLQITLPDFRRLCIFKGIYPREPRNRKKVSKSATANTTFYNTKDIKYLLHEPLLQKFREHKSLAKKIRKALHRGELGDAARLEKNHAPRLSLDHIIKDRYPTFIDALRDLDDALSMLFLFANLPSTPMVPPKAIALCQRLCLEFQHYLIATNSLRKSFLSIKGIYYQATIQGQDILWIVPYRFVQRVTNDVDYRIMGTFVEFYATLLGFVNFRLYSSIGLIYPPKFNKASDDQGGELRALTLEGRSIGSTAAIVVPPTTIDGDTEAPKAITSNGVESKQVGPTPELDSVVRQIAAMDHDSVTPTIEPISNTRPNDPSDDAEPTIDTFSNPIAPDGDTLAQPSPSSTTLSTLFTPFTIYLSRETPRQPLEFLLRAFGCKRIAWDPVLGDGTLPLTEDDPAITHQIVDRPLPPPLTESSDGEPVVRTGRKVIPGRIYIQPQWVWDCVNEGRVLRADLYAPGAELPAHLSPWMKSGSGGYDPRMALAEQEDEGEAEEAEDKETMSVDDGDDNADGVDRRKDDNNAEVDGGMDIAATDEDEDDEDDEDSAVEPIRPKDVSSTVGATDVVDPDEDLDETAIHQRELQAEIAGKPVALTTDKVKADREKVVRRLRRQRKEQKEELERQKMMMSGKKRKILDKMLYGKDKKDEKARVLRDKRRKLEKGQTAKDVPGV